MPMNTEAQEQEMLVQWLRIKKIKHSSNNNENNHSFSNRKLAIIQEAKAKKKGKIKGIPDIYIYLPTKLLAIELKRTKKQLKSGKMSVSHTTTSKEQLEVLSWLDEFSYIEARVCYGYLEARKMIEEYL